MLTSDIRSNIMLLARAQEPWTTQHLVCPVCYGGTSGERTFNLTVEPACIKFMCHRASCNMRGVISSVPSGDLAPRPVSKVREFMGEIEPMPTRIIADLAEQWRIGVWHLEQLHPAWSPQDRRVVYPIYGYNGKTKGHLLRAYDGRKPKTLTYRAIDDVPMTAWYMARDTQSISLVIVEDVLSAVRAAGCGYNAVALLGTHMSMDMVHEIRAFCRAATVSDVVLALDNDAFSKALDLAQRYKLILPMRVVKLERDLKDESDIEIERILS